MPLQICGIPELVERLQPSVTHVLSFLDPPEPEPTCLGVLPARQRHLFRVHDSIVPVPGEITPDAPFVEKLIDTLTLVADDKPSRLLIHCHAGRSRSTAAALIWLWQTQRLSPAGLQQELLSIRSIAWPNSLILRLADEQLGTGGALGEAGRLVRRRTAESDPNFVEWLRHTHRLPEVEEALADLAATRA